MIRVAVFTISVGLALGALSSFKEDLISITKDNFVDEFKIHTADHDIVKIVVPLNTINFKDDSKRDEEFVLFFVEADVKDGDKEYKGIFVLRNGQVTKLLDTGTDVSAAKEDTVTAYFGASDGLYVYNEKENTAENYGSVTDSIIGLANDNHANIIYILTDKHELYKVTDKGTKKEKVDDVVGAQQIVLDYSNNLYYYDANKQAYVVTKEGVKKVEGLPSNPTYMNILKPPFIMNDGVALVVNDKSYVIYVNGSSEITNFEVAVKPSAYSIETSLIGYLAYDKSIYRYNILTLIFGGKLDEINEL